MCLRCHHEICHIDFKLHFDWQALIVTLQCLLKEGPNYTMVLRKHEVGVFLVKVGFLYKHNGGKRLIHFKCIGGGGLFNKNESSC